MRQAVLKLRKYERSRYKGELIKHIVLIDKSEGENIAIETDNHCGYFSLMTLISNFIAQIIFYVCCKISLRLMYANNNHRKCYYYRNNIVQRFYIHRRDFLWAF